MRQSFRACQNHRSLGQVITTRVVENVDPRSPDADELSGMVVRERERETTKNTPHRTSRDTLGHATIESKEAPPSAKVRPPAREARAPT